MRNLRQSIRNFQAELTRVNQRIEAAAQYLATPGSNATLALLQLGQLERRRKAVSYLLRSLRREAVGRRERAGRQLLCS